MFVSSYADIRDARRFVMRKDKRANQKRKQVVKEAQDQSQRVARKYQEAATTGLEAAGFEATSRAVVEFNKGLREIADEMSEYSKRSFEDVFRAWQHFVEARPLRTAMAIQARHAQSAYEAYVAELSRLGELYLGLTRRSSTALKQVSRRSRQARRRPQASA
jgi:hypothetical protein